MTRKRRNHSPEFKAKVALAAAKGDKIVAELAQKYNLHPNQISTWKKELLENAAMIFVSESQLGKDNSETLFPYSEKGSRTLTRPKKARNESI